MVVNVSNSLHSIFLKVIMVRFAFMLNYIGFHIQYKTSQEICLQNIFFNLYLFVNKMCWKIISKNTQYIAYYRSLFTFSLSANAYFYFTLKTKKMYVRVQTVHLGLTISDSKRSGCCLLPALRVNRRVKYLLSMFFSFIF